MKVAYSPIYSYQLLPEGHRFPMEKYDLLPLQLMLEGVVEEEDFFHPDPLSEDQILRTHTIEYWEKLKNGRLTRKEIRNMGFPFHESLVYRGRHIANGTLACAKHALLTNEIALNIAGGTHHAYAERGEGFCMFNDFAITANELLHEGLVKQVLIVDLDVHQGNGNAKIFEHDDRVFTFSMHGEHNYPLRKEKSNLDIGLPDKIKDEAYLNLLAKHFPPLLDQVKPDLVLYLSGVDILSTDKLGRLGVSKEGCKKRDEFVLEHCKKHNLPVAISMGGGYSEQIKDIIEAHANTFKVAKAIYE